ncbi:hypothetical protein, partial [Enterococcus faecium]|uniref:hypothetical protein n=1 Tax=Enterococcus faecium TaxID=1352 RepID=UPI001CE24B62
PSFCVTIKTPKIYLDRSLSHQLFSRKAHVLPFLLIADPLRNSGSKVAKFGKCFGIFRIIFVVKLTTKFCPILTTLIVNVGQSRTIRGNMSEKWSKTAKNG